MQNMQNYVYLNEGALSNILGVGAGLAAVGALGGMGDLHGVTSEHSGELMHALKDYSGDVGNYFKGVAHRAVEATGSGNLLKSIVDGDHPRTGTHPDVTHPGTTGTDTSHGTTDLKKIIDHKKPTNTPNIDGDDPCENGANCDAQGNVIKPKPDYDIEMNDGLDDSTIISTDKKSLDENINLNKNSPKKINLLKLLSNQKKEKKKEPKLLDPDNQIKITEETQNISRENQRSIQNPNAWLNNISYLKSLK